MLKVNPKYKSLYETPKNIRYVLIAGGRGGGKSYEASRAVVLQLASQDYFRGFIMRNILDNVRDSIYQDCVDRINELELLIVTSENMHLRIGGNQLKARGFKKSSGNDTAKNKSVAGINYLLIEEAEEISQEDFDQIDLSLRTKKAQVTIVLVFNPPQKNHWILERWFNLLPTQHDGFYSMQLKQECKQNTEYIFSHYTDNLANLDSNQVARMQSFEQTDQAYFLHKIQGLVPSGKTGLVYNKYNVITEQEYNTLEYPTIFGLDFGFVNDPTALVEIKKHNNKLYIHELLYAKHYTNPQIASNLTRLGVTNQDTVYADSAEQKSIQEINDFDFNLIPSKKGAGSILEGINKINEYELYVTDTSTNLITELQNYTWKKGRDNELKNEAVDNYNHLLDALRYAIYSPDKISSLVYFV